MEVTASESSLMSYCDVIWLKRLRKTTEVWVRIAGILAHVYTQKIRSTKYVQVLTQYLGGQIDDDETSSI
jgi:hypothetical protein